MWKEKRIIDTIHPHMFIRYDERINRLYDSISGVDVSTNPSILI